jgi:hypothetical protein
MNNFESVYYELRDNFSKYVNVTALANELGVTWRTARRYLEIMQKYNALGHFVKHEWNDGLEGKPPLVVIREYEGVDEHWDEQKRTGNVHYDVHEGDDIQ